MVQIIIERVKEKNLQARKVNFIDYNRFICLYIFLSLFVCIQVLMYRSICLFIQSPFKVTESELDYLSGYRSFFLLFFFTNVYKSFSLSLSICKF